MAHRDRILRILRGLPTLGRARGSLSRQQLEGYAKTAIEKRAASALIDYMLAAGEIKAIGGPRNRTYGLAQPKEGFGDAVPRREGTMICMICKRTPKRCIC